MRDPLLKFELKRKVNVEDQILKQDFSFELTLNCRFFFQFKLREVCQGKYLNLACSQPDERIAIYSATLNSTAGSHLYCQQPTIIKPQQPQEDNDDIEEVVSKELKCESNSVTETVMRLCHGKSKLINVCFD
jgi:hypothetical protein